MWLTLAAAGFFGIIVLITLLRAEKSVANGALTVITLLAIGVAVAATIRGFGPGGQAASVQTRNVQPMRAALPQLSCIDDLAGDAVLNACEKVLFGSAESSAAAVAYAASLITQLVGRRQCRHLRQEPEFRISGAAPRGRARPLWVDGLCADGARPLHATGLSGVSCAGR